MLPALVWVLTGLPAGYMAWWVVPRAAQGGPITQALAVAYATDARTMMNLCRFNDELYGRRFVAAAAVTVWPVAYVTGFQAWLAYRRIAGPHGRRRR